MSEKEKIVAEVTEKATKEAQAKKLNASQTKLYVDEQVKSAVAELEKEEKTEKKAESKQEETKVENKKAENKKAENKVEKKEKYIVKTPVKNFNGEVAGVQFAYGRAEVKPGWILNWFKEHGYRVEEVSE